MTISEIEGEGWELYAKSIDHWFRHKDPFDNDIQDYYRYKPYGLYLNYGFKDNRLIIKADFSGGEGFQKSEILFDGECKDLNMLRFICSLLKINRLKVISAPIMSD